jgi:hypothetical protein
LINDQDTRNDFTTQAFQTINSQAEAIIKAKDKTVEIANSWMSTFYKQMQRYTDQSLERIAELRKQVVELQQTIKEKDTQILNDALVKQKNEMLIDQCSNAYERTYGLNKELYEHYEVQRNYNQKVQKSLPPIDVIPGVDPTTINDLHKARIAAEAKTGAEFLVEKNKLDFTNQSQTPKEVRGKGKK